MRTHYRPPPAFPCSVGLELASQSLLDPALAEAAGFLFISSPDHAFWTPGSTRIHLRHSRQIMRQTEVTKNDVTLEHA
jgi:hypothetical protein